MFALVYALAADALERRARRLAKYARYNASPKGMLRNQTYSTSTANMLASRRWRETHPRTPASYQLASGHWRNPVRVDR
jgi:hypothetical protein